MICKLLSLNLKMVGLVAFIQPIFRHRDGSDHGPKHQPARGSRTTASRAAHHRQARRRHGSRPANRSLPPCSAARRPATRRSAPTSPRKRRDAQCARARSVRAQRRTPRGRTARHRPACRRRSLPRYRLRGRRRHGVPAASPA